MKKLTLLILFCLTILFGCQSEESEKKPEVAFKNLTSLNLDIKFGNAKVDNLTPNATSKFVKVDKGTYLVQYRLAGTENWANMDGAYEVENNKQYQITLQFGSRTFDSKNLIKATEITEAEMW